MSMKLQRLADYAAPAAYVSAGSLIAYFLVVEQFGAAIVKAAPGLYVPVVIVSFLAFALWVAGLTVVIFGDERHDHPAPSTRWLQVARGATLVALVVQVPLDIGLIVNAGVPVQAPSYFLIYGGVGTSLLICNLAGRSSGLLYGVLAWLGIVTGAAYGIAGIGFGSFPIVGIGVTLYMVGFNVLMLGQVLYIVWAIWLGVKLSRSKATAPVAVVSATR